MKALTRTCRAQTSARSAQPEPMARFARYARRYLTGTQRCPIRPGRHHRHGCRGAWRRHGELVAAYRTSRRQAVSLPGLTTAAGPRRRHSTAPLLVTGRCGRRLIASRREAKTRGRLRRLGHYRTLGIKDVIVTFSYPDCLSSSALARASFGVLKLSA
jgi:hypothetical protein